MFVRSAAKSIWKIRADVTDPVVDELNQLARKSRYYPTFMNLHCMQLVMNPCLGVAPDWDRAFTFPHNISSPSDVVLIEEEQCLDHHFNGWIPGEILAGGLR